MKRLLASTALFLCSLLTFAQFSGSGSGTKNDPYLILNPIQLNQMRNFLNQYKVYFKLMADIDLTEFIEDEYPSEGWTPIGTSSTPFSGVLDGNGKTISGLWMDRPNKDYVGLFAYINVAEIKNLTLTNSSIKGNRNVGMLVGYGEDSQITNCTVEGEILGNANVGGCIGSANAMVLYQIASYTTVKANNCVGGVIGNLVIEYYENSSITECSFYGDIDGGNSIGGIGGNTERISNTQGKVDISNCHVKANIIGSDYVGGVCGKWGGSYSCCSFIGEIKANSYVGGVCGFATMGGVKMEKCFALSNISANANYVGGLSGYSLMIIKTCYFSGTVVGYDMVGGLVGYKNHQGIEHSYSNVVVKGNKNVGGICGMMNNDTSEALLVSNVVIATTINATEGLVGRIYGACKGECVSGEMGTPKENKAWNRTIVIDKGVVQDIRDDEQNGAGSGSSTLKNKATYVAMGWDFTDVWEIQETESYPYFKTQTAPPVITSSIVSGATSVSGKCASGATVTLEIDGVKKQEECAGTTFLFTVDPLQAGHEVRISAKADGKEQSYFTTEVVSFLGKGTEADPYQISTAADLTQVYRKGYYKLMNDIDLTSYINTFSPTEGWQSIGRDGSETINFDGNGHKVTGLWCNSTRDNTGLFSCFANGYIKNLTVETANGKQVKGGNYTGIIIGKLINGEMTNCKVTGTLADGTPVGGLMGKLDGGTVSRCQADVSINVTGDNSYIGGLIGEVDGEVDQCLSFGTLTATGKTSYVGGLVGLSNSGSSIKNSYSSAVTNSSLSAAGIVAYNYGVVDKCYAVGNVYSKNYGAGVVGYNDGEGAVVKNCVAMNNKLDVTFESQSAQSGGYGQRIIGGIKNGAPAPEMNNYALKTMQVSVNNIAQKVYDDIMNGTAKTAAQLKAKATYEELGWDFNTIWKIEEGASYPYQLEIVNVADPDNPDNPDDSETVDVTDISKLTDAIYAESAATQPGSEATITICLKNAKAACAYNFDLELPEGVSLATNSKGEYQYTLSDRHNGHSETINYQAGSGVYSFAVLSLQSKEIKGSDGAIWTLKIKVDDDVANGDYAIKISNAKYSLTSGSSTVPMSKTTSKLTISQNKKGDVNNDNDVDIADAVCIVNYVVGKETPSFVKLAADVNGDGDVDIADAVRIINLVVGKIKALSRSQNSFTRTAIKDSGSSTDAFTIDDVSLFPGGECNLTISMKNAQTTNAYSFDIVLPNGISIAQDEDGEFIYELSDRHNGHMTTLNYIGNNTYSFAVLSLQSKEINGNEGAICTLKLKADDQMKAGKYTITINNGKYSLITGASKVPMPEVAGQLMVKKVGDTNGDGEVDEKDVNAITSYILGKAPEGFDIKAADLNGDEVVNVADIVELVDLLGKQ